LKTKIKKYSYLIRPLIILFDIIFINYIIYYFSSKEFLGLQFRIYITILWLTISYFTKFYNVYRYTHILRILSLLAAQFFIFILAFFAYFSIFKEGEVISKQSNIISSILLVISTTKFLYFFILQIYRSSGKNFRTVIVIGDSKSAQDVVSIFNNNQHLGYRFRGYFSDNKKSLKHRLGTINEGLIFSRENNIDEIYCEVNSVSPAQLKEIINFSNENKIEFRLIPENKAIYSKNFTKEYFGTIPILKPKKLPFEKIETHLIKRCFDIVFSMLVIIFLLSWLLPLLFIAVKINSKGPFLFKQKRDGINGNQFLCFKIRSMKVNAVSDQISAIKNDDRITKIGYILRKTSLDELPQFFNVLIGDMSIVGPRPHMNIQTKKYINDIDNYLTRNSVKPGITGLAQVSGYRGEVKKTSDIVNRVRLDIFYIENWSFLLDLKIIVLTFFHMLRGQKNAY
jgi:putative colanic acid biosynthesis UDP-glucose lipid carrier transferase